MQENFFLSCTETPKQTLNVQMFDDIRYMNSDLQFDQSNSTDLSLKLRGNIFEQCVDLINDEGFNLGLESQSREFTYANGSNRLQQTDVSEPMLESSRIEGGQRTIKSNPRSHNSSSSLQCFDKDEFQSVGFPEVTSFDNHRIQKVKFDSTKSDTISCKVEEDEHKEINQSSVYKTPNYKNNKKSQQKYMTKHSTSDLKLHEERMKQKYGVNLSVRKDVVNKTLFRSLKRFHTEKFFETFELEKRESTQSYLSKISIYCSIMKSKEAEMENNNITLKDVEKFVAIMVSPNHIKNSLNEGSDANLYKDYYSCLYQYSHKKLASMLCNRVCSFLFSMFIKDGHLSNFIFNCPTMSQNKDIYQKAGECFLANSLGRKKKSDDEISFNYLN